MAVVALAAAVMGAVAMGSAVDAVAVAKEAATVERPAEGWATTVEVASAMVVEVMAAGVGVPEAEEKAVVASAEVGQVGAEWGLEVMVVVATAAAEVALVEGALEEEVMAAASKEAVEQEVAV